MQTKGKFSTIEHTLAPAYAKHIAEVRQQISENERTQREYEGLIRRLEKEADTMKKHLQTLLTLIVEVDRLPASVEPWSLSQDGSRLTGKIAVVEEADNGMAE